MTRLVKAFLDIALWRKTPDVLPASTFLLVLVAIADALVEALGGLLPPEPGKALVLRVAFAVIMPLGFTWLLLASTRRRERFLQTGSAVLGIEVLAGIVLYPLGAAVLSVGADKPWAPPLAVALYAGYFGYLLAGANIWRSALDSSAFVGGLVSLGYFLLNLFLAQQLLSAA